MGAMERRRAWQRKLNEGRWAAINWPSEWGGRDATVTQNVIYTEEMATYRTPGIYNANGLWQIGPMIIRWGTDEQKDRWIPNILDADDHWCQGFTEPRPASDLANLRTLAVARRRRLRPQRPEDLDLVRAHREVGPVPRAHRPDRDRARARKHEGITALDHRPGGRRHRDPPDPRHHRRGDVLRGVLHRRPGAGRRTGSATRARAGRSRWARSATSGSAPPAWPSRCGPTSTRWSTSPASVNPDALATPSCASASRDAHTEIEYTRLLNYRALSKILARREELARGAARQAAVALPRADARRARGRPARPVGACSPRAAPDAVDGGAWNRLYVFQRYTSIGAGTTEVQKNIIADRAIKLLADPPPLTSDRCYTVRAKGGQRRSMTVALAMPPPSHIVWNP